VEEEKKTEEQGGKTENRFQAGHQDGAGVVRETTTTTTTTTAAATAAAAAAAAANTVSFGMKQQRELTAGPDRGSRGKRASVNSAFFFRVIAVTFARAGSHVASTTLLVEITRSSSLIDDNEAKTPCMCVRGRAWARQVQHQLVEQCGSEANAHTHTHTHTHTSIHTLTYAYTTTHTHTHTHTQHTSS
jgi:hypothetical protein